jgi:soluble lytic murein transglycosylase-like protein
VWFSGLKIPFAQTTGKMRQTIHQAILHHTHFAMRTLEVLFVTAMVMPAHAGEYVIFSSGFKHLVERHETVGDKVLLYSKDGKIEVDAIQISGFEAEEVVAAPAAESAGAEIPASEPAPPPDIKQLVIEAAERYGIDPAFVQRVVAQESNYRADAVSPVGAIGPMQLMPGTAAMYGADPHDPEQNIDAGMRYLRDLLLMYKNEDTQLSHTLAAYNAGPGAVAKYKGVPPYRETREYVRRILDRYKKDLAARKRS